MKNKILLVILLISCFAMNASAYKIIIRGGGSGRVPKFRTVILTSDFAKCTGDGNNICPVSFGQAQSMSTGKWYSFDDVIIFVSKQLAYGNKSGNVKFKDDLPVSWKMADDDINVEINTVEKAISGFELYEHE